jgi:hypothetical protein
MCRNPNPPLSSYNSTSILGRQIILTDMNSIPPSYYGKIRPIIQD